MKRFLSFLLSALFPPSEREIKAKKILLENLPRNTQEIPLVKNAFALWDYSSEDVRNVIWLIKYRGDKETAEKAGLLLSDHLQEELAEKRAFQTFLDPLIIPIPLSRARFRERGYNQSLRIAKVLSRELNIPISETLIKVKNTKSQTELTHQERRKNILGVFEVRNRKEIEGKDIILVDDVITTGSTLKEASTTLKKCGVRNILCVALAH